MKKSSSSLLTLISICLLPFILLSQSGSFNYEDFKYYYLINGQVTDVRTAKPIPNFPTIRGEVGYMVNEKLLCMNQGGIVSYYDNAGKLKCSASTSIGSTWISPDYKKILFAKENDIWTADIDLKTGKPVNEKKLTQLGIFARGFNILHWYENNVIIPISEECYGINIETGSITKLEFLTQSIYQLNLQYALKYACSPNGRFVILLNNKHKDFVFDMLTLKKVDLASDIQAYQHYFYFWTGNNNAIVYNGDTDIFAQGL